MAKVTMQSISDLFDETFFVPTCQRGIGGRKHKLKNFWKICMILYQQGKMKMIITVYSQ